MKVNHQFAIKSQIWDLAIGKLVDTLCIFLPWMLPGWPEKSLLGVGSWEYRRHPMYLYTFSYTRSVTKVVIQNSYFTK
jgi:hypothetical protein